MFSFTIDIFATDVSNEMVDIIDSYLKITNAKGSVIFMLTCLYYLIDSQLSNKDNLAYMMSGV